MTTAWFLAPPRACTRLPLCVPRSWMYLAIGVEPTNEIAATSGWSSSASTATLSPCTTLKTPSGSPASRYSSAMKFDADGSRSDGLSTNVLPVAMAIGCIHIGTITGKLNGVIPAHTPSGWRNECRSTSVETCSENSPLSSSAIPQAYSATSMPRMTSPLASSNTLPCSADTIRARSSVCLSTRLRKANMMRARRVTDTSPQRRERVVGGAHGRVDVGRLGERDLAWCSPVAGFHTGEVRVDVAGRLAAGDHVLDGLQRCRAHGVFTLSRVLRYGRCWRLCCS